MTPKYGGAAATAWATRRGPAAAPPTVAPSSQHAADTSHAAAVPDAVVATAAAAAASGSTQHDSDALLAIRTCSVVSTSRSHVSPAARGGSKPAVGSHTPSPAGVDSGPAPGHPASGRQSAQPLPVSQG